jgi:hypothetical protein
MVEAGFKLPIYFSENTNTAIGLFIFLPVG